MREVAAVKGLNLDIQKNPQVRQKDVVFQKSKGKYGVSR